MTYDEYTVKVRARMKKLVRFENFIKKYRFLMIAVADILFIAFIFTMYFAGSYIRDLSARNVVYGDEGITRAVSFLSRVEYKYIENGEEKTGLPYGAGTFDITAETKNPFGVVRRQTASLIVFKRPAIIKLSDFSVEYGEEPDIKSIVSSSDLAEGDVITDAEISYGRFEKTSDAAITSVKIVNKYGYDVTSSYDLKLGSGKAAVLQRKITVDTGSSEKKYDGKELICKEFEITQGSLAYEDRIEAEFPVSVTKPGAASNKADIKIYSKDGEDVSDKYTVTERIGSLTVHPLVVRIKTGSAEKEYDGKSLSCTEYELVSTDFPEGYGYEVSGFSKITDPGSVYNSARVKVTDQNHVYVYDDIYEVKLDRGTLTVKGRKITLRSSTSVYVYNGKPHNANRTVKLVSGELYKEDSFSTYNHPSKVFAGEYENTFSVTFSGRVPKNAYDITYEYGTLKITKKPLTLTVTVHGDAARGKNAFTADISGSVVETDTINTPLFIPADTAYGAFENYISNHLVISHGSSKANIADSYDITYIIKYDENELDSLRAEAGVTGNGGGGGAPDGEGTSGSGKLPDMDLPDETGPKIPATEKYGPSGIGSAGVGGGIDNSPSPYAELPDDAPDVEKTAVGNISSYREGAVYLRLRSFGNYTGSGWAEPALYEKTASIHPLDMTYAALLENNYAELNEIEVEYNAEDGLVPVPYYTLSQRYKTSLLMTDVAVPRENKDKTFYYNQIPVLGISSLLSLEDAGTVDVRYKEFVYENYLSLPESTETEINRVIKDAGLDISSPTIIQDVADFVKRCASYNGSFEKIPDGEDRVIYFLTKSKEGICGHFASAATVIYRALGIPARYTVGYYVVTDGKYSVTEFYEKDAHAWVEVFVDSIGWIPVEVTSASVGEGGEGSQLRPPQSGSEVFYNRLYYQMASKSKVYDGKPLYSDTAELSPGSNLREGDRIEAKTRSVKYAGTVLSGSTAFSVYDKDGKDVTYMYDITEVGQAELTVLPLTVDLPEIKLYVGQSIVIPSYENAADEKTAALMGVNKIEFDFDLIRSLAVSGDGTVTGLFADSGSTAECLIDFGINSYSLSVNDGGAEIVFSQSFTVLPFENVRIKHEDPPEKQTAPEIIRTTGENGKIYNYLAIKSADAEKYFDGEYLYSSGYEILKGALEESHRAEFEAGSYQLYVGETDNVYRKIRVTDERGADVTGEYIIDFYPGRLTVLPGEYTVTETEIDAEVDEKLPLDSVSRTAGVSNVRVSYDSTGDKPIVRVENGVLIGIEPGVTHINALFHGEDLNGDGVDEYVSSNHILTVNVKPKARTVNAGLYIALVLTVTAAGAAAAFVSLKAARIKKEEALKN
ncbi:MAG: transglutaminase domain-containing protein [Clostridia bacterium]|nr:transglutaminase domain-containing protein [Clostridia bacterium]